MTFSFAPQCPSAVIFTNVRPVNVSPYDLKVYYVQSMAIFAQHLMRSQLSHKLFIRPQCPSFPFIFLRHRSRCQKR
ncbi:hypothetical protein M378DRAFT_453468 [Amanita muscaria Koide BX008]|uniref:Uncharacterized protein n=1 Tax=Amanita muscaria (strain Koide BX008) TaxID=946122 RepID=A0A0C2WJD0_AMAMK|nr:hypothetical protein M378DRAFT_453468 [Amanita muscaria Koide BX008]